MSVINIADGISMQRVIPINQDQVSSDRARINELLMDLAWERSRANVAEHKLQQTEKLLEDAVADADRSIQKSALPTILCLFLAFALIVEAVTNHWGSLTGWVK